MKDNPDYDRLESAEIARLEALATSLNSPRKSGRATYSGEVYFARCKQLCPSFAITVAPRGEEFRLTWDCTLENPAPLQRHTSSLDWHPASRVAFDPTFQAFCMQAWQVLARVLGFTVERFITEEDA